jgi:hypothetical protein
MSLTLEVQLYHGLLGASLPSPCLPIKPNTWVRRMLLRKRFGYSGSSSKLTQIRILVSVQRLFIVTIKEQLPWLRMPSITVIQSTSTLTFTLYVSVLLTAGSIYAICRLLSKLLMGWQSLCVEISSWRFGRLWESNNRPVAVLWEYCHPMGVLFIPLSGGEMCTT